MKFAFRYYSLLLTVTLLFNCGKKPAQSNWRTLFNGTDLSGWDTYLGPTYDSIQNKFDSLLTPGLNNDPNHVFTIDQVDGAPAIHISGNGFGGISTLDEFENFHLRMEFKWGEKRWHPRKDKKRDSGILYYAVGAHGVAYGNWMLSQEFQVQEGDCGDYWSVGGSIIDIAATGSKSEEYVYNPAASLLPFSYTSDFGRRCIKSPDAEKPTGEWNAVDIYCLGGTSVHVMNGQVVMRLFNSRQPFQGREIPLTKGKIQIQTEGAEVFYRNIQIEPIDKIVL